MGERTDPVSGHTRAIRNDIDRTQREMSQTIDEIQYRLSPHYMMQRTKDSVREAGVRTSHTIVDRIRENPIGAAMVGVGLFLLMRSHDHDYDDIDVVAYGYGSDFDTPSGRDFSSVAEYRDLQYEAGSRVDAAKEKVGEKLDSAKEATADAMHAAAQQAQHLRDVARYRARNARFQARDLMRDNPIIAGVAALALGAIVGGLIPESDRENALMGETRDRLLDRGKDLAREGVDRATNIAKAATTAATDAAKNEAKNPTASKTDIGQNIGI